MADKVEDTGLERIRTVGDVAPIVTGIVGSLFAGPIVGAGLALAQRSLAKREERITLDALLAQRQNDIGAARTLSESLRSVSSLADTPFDRKQLELLEANLEQTTKQLMTARTLEGRQEARTRLQDISAQLGAEVQDIENRNRELIDRQSDFLIDSFDELQSTLRGGISRRNEVVSDMDEALQLISDKDVDVNDPVFKQRILSLLNTSIVPDGSTIGQAIQSGANAPLLGPIAGALGGFISMDELTLTRDDAFKILSTARQSAIDLEAQNRTEGIRQVAMLEQSGKETGAFPEDLSLVELLNNGEELPEIATPRGLLNQAKQSADDSARLLAEEAGDTAADVVSSVGSSVRQGGRTITNLLEGFSQADAVRGDTTLQQLLKSFRQADGVESDIEAVNAQNSRRQIEEQRRRRRERLR